MEKHIKKFIENIVPKLSEELKNRYGGSGFKGYSEGQINRTMQELKIDKKYEEIAILIFNKGQVPFEPLEERTLFERVLARISKYGSEGGMCGAGGGD
jgi:uncharacterized protein YneR